MVNLYRHYDSDEKLLYVGVSLNVVNRLCQHRVNSNWFSKISQIKIEQFKDRESALKAESEAIIKEKPIFNIQGQNRVEPKLPKIDDADLSKEKLVSKIVNFNPTYTIEEIRNMTGMTKKVLKELIADKKIGSVVVGTNSSKWGYSPKVRITGWQLIEFLESLQNGEICLK